VRVPTVLIVTVTNGQIARFEEYADSTASKALFGEEVDAIRDEHANFTSE
jgi:ketosteroid isomerase-like protein